MRRHYAHLDGLRGYAALYVVLHHTFLTIWPIDLGVWPQGLDASLTRWLAFGRYAVVVFIVLSGYVLTLPILNAGSLASGFLLARARRILPAYYASLALAMLLIAFYIGQKTGTHWDISVPVSASALVQHLLLIHNWTGSPAINHVYWSIAIECQIYLLFPLLVWLYRQKGVVAPVVFALAVGFGGAMAVRGTPFSDANPHFLGLFAIGMLAASATQAEDGWQARLRETRVWPVALIALVLVVGCAGKLKIPLEVTDLLVACFACALLILAGRAEGVARSVLAFRPMVWIGTFSYSLYLIHAPLLQVIWQLAVPKTASPLLQMAIVTGISIPLVLAASYGFFLAFERPFMSKRQRSAVAAEQGES